MSFENSGWKSNNNQNNQNSNNNWKQRQGGNSNGNKEGEPWKPDDTPPDPAKPYIPYAIMGDPETPANVVEMMMGAAKEFEGDGFTARTGCDNIVAKAVSSTVKDHEVYVPWKGFGGQEEFFGKTNKMIERVACHFAPYLLTGKRTFRVIQAYYLMLVLGRDANSHSRFLITWTKGGEETAEGVTRDTGNMGILIKAANGLNIPVFNFANSESINKCTRFVSGFKTSQNNDARAVVTKPPSRHYNDESSSDDFNY